MIELVKQTCQEEIYEHSRISRKLSGGYPHNQKRKGLGSFYRYRQSPELFKAQRKRGNEKSAWKRLYINRSGRQHIP